MSRSLNIRRLAVAVLAALAVAAVVAWHYDFFAVLMPRVPNNSIMVISPYRYNGTWVFDDANAGLKREPFVGGIPEMIDFLVAKIPHADKGFRLTFSAQEFPGYQKKLRWVRGDATGNWYRLDKPPMEGWLCPTLFRYYPAAPKELYVRADPKE
jgi:hypothetical protein